MDNVVCVLELAKIIPFFQPAPQVCHLTAISRFKGLALCATQRQEQGDPGITGGDDDVEVTGGQWLGRNAVKDSIPC